MDPTQGLFTFEYLLEMYQASFYWMNVMMDRSKPEHIKERRRYLEEGDGDRYRASIRKFNKLADEYHHYFLAQLQKKTKILPESWQVTMMVQVTLAEDKSRPNQLKMTQQKARARFFAIKA